jgi:protein phosphatase
VKSIQQKVECVGKIPTARFGHTIVMVSPVKVVLFGGAVGDTKNFQFTNDTYVLNLMTKIWLKLESNNLIYNIIICFFYKIFKKKY